MSYKFHSDEKVWQVSVFDEEMTLQNGGETTDMVEDAEGYYWITSTERDEVLKVSDFAQGEEIVKKLGNGDLNSFEEATGKHEYTEIRDVRPPY